MLDEAPPPASPPEASPPTSSPSLSSAAVPRGARASTDAAETTTESNRPPSNDDECRGTTRSDRLVLAVLAGLCVVALGFRWWQLGGGGEKPVEADRQTPLFHDYKLDPNEATWVEWMQLEGVGEVLARRIVEDREAHGPFESIDDLARVRGIGAKTVEKLRPWLEIRPTDESK